MPRRFLIGLIMPLLTLACASCAGPPVAVQPAEIDCDASAQRMVELYDTDGSGSLSQPEAGACFGLEANFQRYDANGDGELAHAEILDRLRSWSAGGAGVLRVACRVMLNGKPLSDAQVALRPHTFLVGDVHSAFGTTDANGQCRLSVDPNDLPPALKRVRGVQPGLYLVHITHPQIDLADNDNSTAAIGLEVAEDTIAPTGVEFAVSSH